MTGMPEDAGTRPARPRGAAGPIRAMEHAQDLVTATVGVILIGLAAVLVVSGVIQFFTEAGGSVTTAAAALLDRLLLVLILVEIVHTVVLSLRAHRLAAGPFIVVGLVAVIRRILLVLSNEARIGVAELGILIGMMAAFTAGLIAVNLWGRQQAE